MSQTSPPICDYEGSGYRTDFWEGQGRAYEDLAERAALRRLLPTGGRRVAHLGAGFGRMTGELAAWQQVIVLDYSRTMLRDAQKHLGSDPRYVFVAADIYHLPLAPGSCDAAVMERVIHHFADVPAALGKIRSALAPGSAFILEYASKRHLKAIVRYLLRRQDWNPFDLDPVEFVKLNFDFHPDYMTRCLREAGFTPKKRLALSYFRSGLLKRRIPTGLLVALDRLLQPTGQIAPFSPSVFTLNIAAGDTPPDATTGPLFACLDCGTVLEHRDQAVACPACGTAWPVSEGLYDFKTRL